MAGGYRLAIDFGTSNTVAAIAGPDGRVRTLLFDGSPLLASAVFADRSGARLTGADAVRASVGFPAGLESNPKRRIDDGTIWLGEREHLVVDVIAAVLARVEREAARVAGGVRSDVVLTHPAAWGATRLGVLAEAARRAGLGSVRFVAEPVAAATYFGSVLGRLVPAGRSIVVYDLGAGTFDVSIVRSDTTVLASAGLDDTGGLDLDAAVVRHARTVTAAAGAAWQRLDWPQSPADMQARQVLWQGARAVKEQLSRHTVADLQVPLVDQQVRLTRDEFERAIAPILDRTAGLTHSVLRTAALPPEDVAGVFLVGGASRTPLAATLLHRALGIAPVIIDQPELVVAEGALHAGAPPAAVQTPPAAAPAPPPQRVYVTRSARRASPKIFIWIAVGILAVGAAIAGAVVYLDRDRGGGPGANPKQSTASSAPAGVFPADFEGTWSGTLEQSDGESHPITLAVPPGSTVAQVRYPDIRCIGTLTVESRDGNRIQAREKITDGRCTPTGKSTLELRPDGRLALDYKPDLAGYTAHATLTRTTS